MGKLAKGLWQFTELNISLNIKFIRLGGGFFLKKYDI